MRIDALGPDGAYQTRNAETITTTGGTVVAELSIVPPLYISRAISAQRSTRPLPAEQREAGLAKAAQLFATGVIAGLDFDSYVALSSRISGVPVKVTRASAVGVADAVASAFGVTQLARPAGAVTDWRDESTRGGSAVWVRRGEVFGVLASGNGPGVHGLWPQALALGYRVAVRPSPREPLTPYRLVNALRQAGFRYEDTLYLPTDHRGADELVRSADLTMVYGSQEVVDMHSQDPTVLVNGPGRAKILITADQDWRDYLDVITDSIANLGGIACVNTTAVLSEGDPTPLAHAIGDRLSSIPVLPIENEQAVLPTQNVDEAKALALHLAAQAAGTIPVLGADQVVAALTNDCAALRPAVHLLARPDVAKLNTELPFPCVWVSSWSRADGLAPLRNSLVVNAITNNEDLIDDLLGEPTIANVYRGHHPTYYAAPEIPHDGFLADFLMRNKGFIRD
jgi:acyl-CoA reductase-like NAD-dependent aldehyde dehydrogenase